MNKDISAYSYSGNNRSSPHRFRSFFVCYLLSVFCLFSFSSCVTTPNTKDIKRAEAYNKLGIAYLKNQQPDKAYVEFQKAIKYDPKNKESFNFIGYINATWKKYDEAIANYKRAISIDPDYSDATNNLGVVYLEINNWDEAIRAFTSALDNPLYSTPVKAYSNLGYAYYMNGDYHEAENALQEALIRNPAYPRANYTLGLVYLKIGNDEKATKEFMQAIAIYQEYMDAHWELANIYLKTGKNAKAMKHLEIVAEKDIERGRKAIELIEKLKY